MGKGNEQKKTENSLNDLSPEKDSDEREAMKFALSDNLNMTKRKRESSEKKKRRKMSERGETPAWNVGDVHRGKITGEKKK